MLSNPSLERGTMVWVFRLLIDEFSFARTFPRSRRKAEPFLLREVSEDRRFPAMRVL
jgi:hypothetical protein